MRDGVFDSLPERQTPRIPGRLALSIDVPAKWPLLMEAVRDSGKHISENALRRLKKEEIGEKGGAMKDPPKDFEHYLPDDCKPEFEDIKDTSSESELNREVLDLDSEMSEVKEKKGVARFEERSQLKILIVTNGSIHKLEQVSLNNNDKYYYCSDESIL